MRYVIKGINFTEIISYKKGEFTETIQFWRLKKPRKSNECGIWKDGKKIKTFEEMERTKFE